MRILNQLGKHITDRHEQTTYREKITHMIDNGYTSMVIDEKRVELLPNTIENGEVVINIFVEGLV